ncbi:hypothetical protein POX_a00731 [Penicillium oxalicum]|uniref:hypothetical protein n=1 Tax=Penicillium oxalicum TaxID=69781 RepID=UPI0020B8CB2E|nr:hypothetical protein POX_a00731 [Penicillium oxalicum]KAI2794141.1 hypothetical protein POX_a00731 [Penicillium oxalicum]
MQCIPTYDLEVAGTLNLSSPRVGNQMMNRHSQLMNQQLSMYVGKSSGTNVEKKTARTTQVDISIQSRWTGASTAREKEGKEEKKTRRRHKIEYAKTPVPCAAPQEQRTTPTANHGHDKGVKRRQGDTQQSP